MRRKKVIPRLSRLFGKPFGDSYRPLTAAEWDEQQATASLRRLRDILEPDPQWPRWSADEACWFFVGIHHGGSLLSNDEPSMFAWLPGARDSFSRDPWVRELEVEGRLERLASLFQGVARTPVEWLHLAHSFGFRPVWADHAIADPACRKLLPLDVRRNLGLPPDSTNRYALAAALRYADDDAVNAIKKLKPKFQSWHQVELEQSPSGKLPQGALERWCATACDALNETGEFEISIKRMRRWTVTWRNEPGAA